MSGFPMTNQKMLICNEEQTVSVVWSCPPPHCWPQPAPRRLCPCYELLVFWPLLPLLLLLPLMLMLMLPFFPLTFSLPMVLASTALSSFLNWWRHHNCDHKGPFLIKTEFFPRAISPLRNFVTYQHCWDRVWSETEGCLQTENIAVNIRMSDLKCWVVMKLSETLNTHGLHDLELSGLEPLLSSLSSAFYITWSLSNTFKKS